MCYVVYVHVKLMRMPAQLACCKLRSWIACCAAIRMHWKAVHRDFINANAGTTTPVYARMQWQAVQSEGMI